MDLTTVSVPPDAPLIEALRTINQTGLQIALVVDPAGRLLGSITDGDVRRALLRGGSLETLAADVMNPQPVVASACVTKEGLKRMLRERRLHHMPIVDGEGRLIRLVLWDDLLQQDTLPNAVVLMAGGRGTRLGALTRDLPKPLLEIGGRPILETILDHFVVRGFRRFYISVNYRAEMIEGYFGDGSRWGAEIEYLREDEPLGTAGALGLLRERPSEPFFVMNGDVLTTVDHRHVLEHHQRNDAAATICVRRYHHKVPFGVVELSGDDVAAFREKPEIRHLVNAGIYVLSPAALNRIDENAYLDMPTLLSRLMNDGKRVVAHQIEEYWLDVGRPGDLAKAEQEFAEVFTR